MPRREGGSPQASEGRRGKLEIRLLGSPEVLWRGQPLAIPRRAVRALLYLLATTLEAVPRDQLHFLFWPNEPDTLARRRLTHLLTHLRRSLPTASALACQDDHVMLRPEDTWSDVCAFRRGCDGREDGDAVDALEATVRLYRAPFLEGFGLRAANEFEGWIRDQRSDLEHRYRNLLQRLMETWSDRGRPDRALEYGLRYLRSDDLAEGIHARVIALRALMGDRLGAVRHFEELTALLDRELGVSPLPETRAALQESLGAIRTSEHEPTSPPQWTTLPTLEAPLVGRDGPLARMTSSLERAQAGIGSVVWLIGEAGVGKSRLLEEFAAGLPRGAPLLNGSSLRGGEEVPYYALAEALRSGFRRQGLPSDIPARYLAAASRVLPELMDEPGHPPSATPEPGEARAFVLEALEELVRRLVGSGTPGVLCLDDLQWADAETLEWLAVFGRGLKRLPTLLILASRSEDASILEGLRRSLARAVEVVEIQLQGLDPEAAHRLVCHVLANPSGSPSLSARLHASTAGHPFFLLETLRTLIEEGKLDGAAAGSDELPLPDTVRRVIEGRVGRLGPVARQMLEAGSVIGERFAFAAVRRTAGRSEIQALEGLEEAVARQLLHADESGYRFTHDLVRRTVEAAISPPRRQILHRRAGEALETTEPGAWTVLANHFHLGGVPEKAVVYLDRAVVQASAVFAWPEVEGLCARML
ncbi:MAG TPA: AAA family ATPase, partial [Anaerolineales bacterium]|nr:AAA family ATPase [Anaerolineales bacterium]